MAKVPRQRLPRDLRQRAGHLDPGRAAADDDERQQLLAPLRIRLAFGMLEREEHTAADGQGVFERLEPRRQRLPFVVAEVGVRRAARHDQVVVGQLAVGEYQSLPLAIDAADLRQQHLDI